MDPFSISKACFAFKGRKCVTAGVSRQSSEKKRRRGAHINNFYEHDKQYLAYKAAWKSVEDDIQSVQTQVLSDIIEAVATRIEEFSLANDQEFSQDIPTIALITGINLPDNDVIFSELLALLEVRGLNRIAYIKSCDCQNIKTMIQNVTLKLINAFNDENESENSFEYDDSENEELENYSTSKTNCLKWTFQSLLSTFNSWKSTNKSEANTQKLIIIIDDIEQFSPKVFEDFVSICSEYKTELPWVFVCGIPTSTASIHRLLKQSVSKNLMIEKFELPISSHILDQVVNKVLMSDTHPFKLGVKCYKLLEEIFLYHDLSVSGFKRRLKYCMMEHFYSNFISELCCSEKLLQDKIEAIEIDKLENFRKLTSFMKYVESCDPDQQNKLLLNENKFKKFLLKKLKYLYEYHQIFFPVLFCLHHLTCSLPNLPLGRLARELYGKNLEMSLFESPEYSDAIKLLRLLSKDELLSSIENCVATLKEHELNEALNTFSVDLREFINKLKNIDPITFICTTKLSVLKSPIKSKPSPQKYMPTATSRSEFLLNLRVNRPKEHFTIYETIRTEVIDYFDAMFKKVLISPMSLPFHEVMYFNDIRSVKGQLLPTPRSAIHIALNDPQEYLQCGCCSIVEQDSILPTMPDLCILYKLHLECGRMINLYDLLQVGCENIKIKDLWVIVFFVTSRARFTYAVSELQFLGFVKATQRKADHLVRLTWGDY
uniref:Origin recognition complex subunit 3 n=1 Tax=Strigamia maritima TaxID=126957 RepID=T1JB59_STRMM